MSLRDKCWIQNLWSSAVTPKGAFFCEVAGALDALFDGPGGWDVDSEWWKKTPDQFGDQLKWCELCGAALQVPRRQANEEIDDVSPELYEKLAALKSPKLRKKQVDVLNLEDYSPENYRVDPSMQWYLPKGDNRQRISGTNRSLYPQQIIACVFCDDPEQGDLEPFEQHVDRVVFVSRDKPWVDLDGFGVNDWVLCIDQSARLRDDFGSMVRSVILNPGCFYYQQRMESSSLAYEKSQVLNDFGFGENLLFVLFNTRSRAWRSRSDGSSLMSLWERHKLINFGAWEKRRAEPDAYEIEGDLFAQHMASVWAAITAVNREVFLYGAGQHTAWLIQLFRQFELPDPAGILDDAGSGMVLDGIAVQRPEQINRPSAVMLSVNHRSLTPVLERRCKELWGDDVSVIDPYCCLPDKNYRKSIPENCPCAEEI